MVKLTLVCPSLVPRTTLQTWAHLGCAGKWRARLWHRAGTGRPPPHYHRLEGAFKSRAPLPRTQLRNRCPWCRTSTVCAAICPWLRALRCLCILRAASRETLLLGLFSLVISSRLRWSAILGRGLFLLCRLALGRFNSAVVGGRTRGWWAPWPVRGRLIGVSRMAPGSWWRRPSLRGPGSGPAPSRTVCLPIILPIWAVVSIASSVILAPWIKASVAPTEIIGPSIASVVTSEIPVLIDPWVIPLSVMSWRIWSGTRPRTEKGMKGEEMLEFWHKHLFLKNLSRKSNVLKFLLIGSTLKYLIPLLMNHIKKKKTNKNHFNKWAAKNAYYWTFYFYKSLLLNVLHMSPFFFFFFP